MSTEIKHLEFELEKARNGLAMPYDRERVWQLEAQIREARQNVRMRKAKHIAATLRLKLSNGSPCRDPRLHPAIRHPTW